VTADDRSFLPFLARTWHVNGGQHGQTTWMRATSELIQSIAGKHIKVSLFGHIQATFGVVPNMNSFDIHSAQP
jgi:hypothetical protein